MTSSIETIFGTGATVDVIDCTALPGWEKVLLLRGGLSTAVLGLRQIHSDSTGATRVAFLSLKVPVDTRQKRSRDVACELINAIDDAPYDANYRNGFVSAYGEFGHPIKQGFVSSVIAEMTNESTACDIWTPFLRDDVILADTYPTPGKLLREGVVVKNGALSIDENVGRIMQPAVSSFSPLFDKSSIDLPRVIDDMMRGSDAVSALSRGTGLAKENILAMRADNLAAMGISDPFDDEGRLAIRGLCQVPKDKIPQTPKEMECMLDVLTFAENIQFRGLRTDAPSAFLTEAGADWARAGRRVRAAGHSSMPDMVWKAIDEPVPEPKIRMRMSLLPHLSLKEATHLCQVKNERDATDRYTIRGLPRTLDDKMEIEGGYLLEVPHRAALETLDLVQGRRKDKEMWSDLEADITSGNAYVFAVRETNGTPIAAILVDVNDRTQQHLLTKVSKYAEGIDLIDLAKAKISDELLSKPERIAARKIICDAEKPRISNCSLEHYAEARREAKRTSLPVSWTSTVEFLPAVLRRIGPDGLKQHCANVLDESTGIGAEASSRSVHKSARPGPVTER